MSFFKRVQSEDIKGQLFLSHLTLSAIGVVLLILAFFATLMMRNIAIKVVESSQPKMETIDHIANELMEAELALKDWVNRRDDNQRAKVILIWEGKIFPSLAHFQDLVKDEGHVVQDLFNDLKSNLVELESLHSKVSRISGSPENKPHRVQFSNSVSNILLRTDQNLKDFKAASGNGLNADTEHYVRSFWHNLNLSLNILNSYLDNQTSERKGYFQSTYANGEKYLGKIKKLRLNLKQKKIVAAIESDLQVFIVSADEVIKFRDSPKWNESKFLLNVETPPILYDIYEILDELENIQSEELKEDAETTIFIGYASIGMTFVLIIVMIVAAYILSKRNAEKLAAPIQALTQAAGRFSEGDLKIDIPENTTGEVGELTAAFNRMRDSLLGSYGRLQAVFNTVVEGIVILNEEGKIQNINPSVEDTFGYTMQFLVGKPFQVLLSEEDDSAWATVLEKRGEKNRTQLTEVIGKHLNGDTFPLYLSISEIIQKEQTLYTAVLRDISQEKEIQAALIGAKEKAQSAEQLKSAFLANVSHEIRTPMNSIIGMTGLALGTDLKPNQKRYIQAANAGGIALLKLINDILDLSKMEAGKLTIETIDFDLVPLAEEVTEQFYPEAQKKDLQIALDIDPKIPSILMGDPNRIRQVLMNILGNAIKFTETGAVNLIVTLEDQVDDQYSLLFHIQDTGIGIPPDRVGYIFDSFVQSDSSTSRKYGGTGLGTTISKDLVELMGGKIWLESALGQGTTFFISLTLKSGALDDFQRHSSLQNIGVETILLVEAHVESARAISNVLLNWGCKVLSASTNEEALELVKGKAVDAVILDASLPEFNSLELITKLRERPDFKGVPVVLLFSYLSPSHLSDMEKHSLKHYLFKPVKRSELKNMLVDFALAKRAQSEADSILPKSLPMLPRIIIVEDDLVTQEILESRLSSQEVSFQICGTGEEALSQLRENAYDLMLLDYNLPDYSGMELAKKIQDEDLSGGIPIFSITAADTSGFSKEATAVGIVEFVEKPLDFDKLFHLFEKYLSFRLSKKAKGKNKEKGQKIQLPKSVPGVNLELGVQRWGGEVVYLGALKNFVRRFSEKIEDLEAHVARLDYSAIKQMAHLFKGAAGNMNATELFEAAKKLEKSAVKEKEQEVIEAFDYLKESFNVCANSVKNLLETHSTEIAPAEIKEVSNAEVLDILNKIIEVLNKGEGLEAEKLLQEFQGQLIGSFERGFLDLLLEEINEFNLESASTRLQNIKTELKKAMDDGSG